MLNIARKPNKHTMRIRMRVKLEGVFFFFFFFLCLLLLANNIVEASSVPFNRTLFPECFVFGAGSGAYQMEGAANIDGRGPSIWDTFTHQHPEKIADRSNGDVAVDFYHRYKSDIKLMKKVGLDSYRFSISWSRIFPEGRGKVNDLGVNFYNNLINELLSKGITPIVTLFYWDVPQALEDKYGGFLSRKLVNDFRNYADFCFKIFGDRVKNWVTFNEPFEFINDAYNVGTFAPSRCSNYVANCTAGDSATEPYIVGHHLLLSHAAAVRLYKKKYQASQKGQIGISLVTNWFEPKNNTAADREAADRAQDFWFGWHAHPITYGDYPESMKSLVGDRLPKLTKAESKFVKGTYDFLGLNYYTSAYIEYAPPTTTNKSLSSDMQATLSFFKNGVPIGTPTEMVWIFNYPEGLRKLLVYIKDKYQNPPIYITENGVGQINNASKSVQEAIKDNMRITYHESHLRSLLQAIKNGVNVKRYYILSFLDGFDWTGGYTSRYGLTYVDYKNNLARHLKNSAYWFKKFLLK